jgi:hypothetical protein
MTECKSSAMEEATIQLQLWRNLNSLKLYYKFLSLQIDQAV